MCVCVYLQCIALASFSNFQDERGQDVESLAVAHGLVPAGVGQQHPLQHHPVLLPLLAAVRTAASPVQVLDIRTGQESGTKPGITEGDDKYR